MFKLPKINLKSFKSKSNNNTFFTVDIGSDSIKCFACKLEDGNEGKIEIIGGAKEMLEPGNVRSGNIIELEKVAESLDTALFRATENIEDEISNVIFGISGDLCVNLTTTAKVKRSKKSEIEYNEFEDVENKILATAQERAQEIIYKTTGNSDIDIDLITSSTVYTKVDGKYTSYHDGLIGQDIEHAVFTSFTPVYYLESIQEIASLLKLTIKAITSSMYAFTQALKLVDDNKKLDGVLVDAGSDKTEISIVFGGGIVTSKTLPIGGRHLTTALSQETGLNFTEAERKKQDYTFGNLPESEIMTIENPLNEAVGIWLAGLELLFTEFNGVKTFPTNIFLTGGASKLPLITESLQTKPWTKSIPFKEPPDLNKVTSEKFEHILDATEHSQDEEFTLPAALTIIYLEMQENIT